MIAIKNVLVATDFSDLSQTALGYGRELARTFSAKLHVLHVVDDPSLFIYSDVPGVMPYAEMEAEMRAAAESQLNAAIDACDRRELSAETVVRTGNHTAQEIADYARHAAIDLIVIGATGRGAINRMLMGSVADKIIRQAPCPVLAVRRPEREFVAPDGLQTVEAVKA